MNRLIPILRLLTLTIVLGALLFSSSPGPIVASGPIKLWSGIHLGNRPGADWNSTLLADIDGDRPGGTWPKAVVFLSSQLYYVSRDANCRIKTGPNDTITNRPVLLDYLQRASQSGVRIIIRIHLSPGNFDTDRNLWVGPIPGIGYCDPDNHRPADDIADQMIAIHNYNQAHGITEWGFEPANEPNAEWYPWDSPPQWPKPNSLRAWQDMKEYFKAVWLGVPSTVHALTPPMAQDAFAEMNHTGPNAINDPDPYKWCLPMRLEDRVSTGYGVMSGYYVAYNDGIDWHNYWRLGWENSGTCSTYALHVSYYFPQWMKDILELGFKPGTITEADLFSYGDPPNQDPNQPLHNKDDAYGWPAANSLRKFFQEEGRAQAIVAWLLNDNVNQPDQDHNWHEAYNDETGDSRRIWFEKWWPYFERWASPWFLPDIRKDFNGWNSTILIRNNSSDTAQVHVDLYDQGGIFRGSGQYVAPGNSSVEVIPPVPSNFFGSAIVYSERDVAVVVENQYGNSRSYAYNGIAASDSLNPDWGQVDTTLNAPVIMNDYYDWDSELIVRNAGPATANGNIKYYDPDGINVYTDPFELSPNGSVSTNYYGGAQNTLYSARIVSDQPLAAVVRQYRATPYVSLAYNCFSAGASPIYAPLIMNNYYGWDTSVNIQNTGDSEATVSVQYYDDSGSEVGEPKDVEIPAYASISRYSPSEGLPDDFIGTAEIFSSPPGQWAVVVNQSSPHGDSAERGMSYTGTLTGSNYVVLPDVLNYYDSEEWVSSINVWNLSSCPDWVTLSYQGLDVERLVYGKDFVSFYVPYYWGMDSLRGPATVSSYLEPMAVVVNHASVISTTVDLARSYNGCNR